MKTLVLKLLLMSAAGGVWMTAGGCQEQNTVRGRQVDNVPSAEQVDQSLEDWPDEDYGAD